MPSAIFNKLQVGELKPTHTILQPADRFVRHLRGFVQDILEVEKFTFLTDFYILEMNEDRDIPKL